ncbi:hypothetical protein AB0H36_20760 [Kribbella sp. NPDC050820]|uniref:hypothetical protein n=1 Tax=Kribbella sp. NPDC050820 TaxID=3155408 RepID=UPI003404ADF4
MQVVEARFDKVASAEKHIIELCAGHRTEPHAFMSHFGTKETFRMGAQALIGDLTTYVGRRGRDRTDDWRQRAIQRRGR